MVNRSFWQGKRVFLTGHTGFKGTWMSLCLNQFGSKLKGYAKPPLNQPNMFELTGISQYIESELADINEYQKLEASMKSFNPEVVFHFAAQPLVRESYNNPLETYMTNVIGTAHVLEAVRQVRSIKSVVIITTDKCYENKEWIWPYRENEALGGHDPYSSSKACAEIVTAAYRKSFYDTNQIGVATARAGNVLGGGDFSTDRLIPDIIRSIQNNEVIKLRYPQAIRPWQHVLEPLTGYLLLAEQLYKNPNRFSDSWNFGPYEQDTKTVSEIVELLMDKIGKGSWEPDLNNHPHEAHLLKLDIQKAHAGLNWRPLLTIEQALETTFSWYEAWQKNEDMLKVTTTQIQDFFRRYV